MAAWRSVRAWRAVATGLAVGLALLTVAGPALAQGGASGETTGETAMWLPVNVSTTGERVDQVFNVILYLTCASCVAVFAVMVWFLVRYRHRPGRAARFIHGNSRLETVWTLVPTVILALIAAFSQTSWSAIKYTSAMPKAGDPDMIEMEIVGQQFAWNFHYPGKDGKLGRTLVPELINKNSVDFAEQIGLDRSGDGADDLVSNKMYIPVHKRVYIHLTSKDVIHSFFLPNFRIKQDAMPGLNARVWLEATRKSADVVGTKADGSPKPYDIVCAELCGSGHYKMRGELYVVGDQEFQEFLAREASYLAPAEGGDGGY